ncbi:hypothetical protein [Streptomyces sp. NPDC007063]|uniref:hypothetical protein n=1 Tax=Streptomyces sp. NPDC007063 TaxID=3364772 RepID=UPI0036A25AE3
MTQPGINPRLLTLAEMAAAVDRAPRTARFHLTIMVEAGRLDLDRRTPMPGATVGPRTRPLDEVQTPGQWAATVTLECRGCRRVLTAVAELAGPDWTARGMPQSDLSRYARMTPKTFSVHVGHLEELEVLRREADPIVGPGGRYLGRRPDAYVLLSGLKLVPEILTDPGADLYDGDWATDAAGDLLASLRWFGGPKLLPGDRRAAINRVARHLRDGIPERVLYRMLTRREIRREDVREPYALLLALLPPPGARYIIPAADVVGRPSCPECGVYYEDPDIPPGITCKACTEERYATPF